MNMATKVFLLTVLLVSSSAQAGGVLGANQQIAQNNEDIEMFLDAHHRYTPSQSIFATMAECKNAVEGGFAQNYSPLAKSSKLPFYEKDVNNVRVIYEDWVCVPLDLPGKVDRVVAVAPGHEFFQKKGRATPFALVACGNDLLGEPQHYVRRLKVDPPAVQPPPPAKKEEQVVVPAPLPQVVNGGGFCDRHKKLCKGAKYAVATLLVGALVCAADDNHCHGASHNSTTGGSLPGAGTGGSTPGSGTGGSSPGAGTGGSSSSSTGSLPGAGTGGSLPGSGTGGSSPGAGTGP